MFHRQAARKRIGSSPFFVKRVWSISSASLRNPPTTITTRHFPRSSTRCGSQNRKKNQRKDTEDAEDAEKKRTKISKGRKGRSGNRNALFGFASLVMGSIACRRRR